MDVGGMENFERPHLQVEIPGRGLDCGWLRITII
jgi:hypothetical protein